MNGEKLATRYKLPIEIEPLEEGGYLAICPILQGCHAEGETIAEALENVEDVAHNLIKLMREDGTPFREHMPCPMHVSPCASSPSIGAPPSSRRSD